MYNIQYGQDKCCFESFFFIIPIISAIELKKLERVGFSSEMKLTQNASLQWMFSSYKCDWARMARIPEKIYAKVYFLHDS